VLLTIVELLTWLQPEATGATGGGGAGDAAGPAGCMGGSSQFILLPVMFAVFYFLLIRPQQKKQREAEALLKSLKRGDKVRTSSGIRGEIAELTDNDVNLIIADRVKINVLRSHIAGLDAPPPAVIVESKDKKADDKAKADAKADEKSDKAKNG
jgi:preprotein translocase subunit YajC